MHKRCDHILNFLGTRGLIDDYNILVDDFVEYVNLVRSQYENVPTFILSHSMGTLIALLSLTRLNQIKAVIFSATPICSGENLFI
jgi:alpha-beta hydrolase superfamily lysophospholipase